MISISVAMYAVTFLFLVGVLLYSVFRVGTGEVATKREEYEIDEFNPTECNETRLTCLVCLERYPQNAVVTLLDCGHAFHESCFKKLVYHKKVHCPVCKRNFYIG